MDDFGLLEANVNVASTASRKPSSPQSVASFPCGIPADTAHGLADSPARRLIFEASPDKNQPEMCLSHSHPPVLKVQEMSRILTPWTKQLETLSREAVLLKLTQDDDTAFLRSMFDTTVSHLLEVARLTKDDGQAEQLYRVRHDRHESRRWDGLMLAPPGLQVMTSVGA